MVHIIGQNDIPIIGQKLEKKDWPKFPTKVLVDHIYEVATLMADQDGKTIPEVLRTLAEVYEILGGKDDDDDNTEGTEIDDIEA